MRVVGFIFTILFLPLSAFAYVAGPDPVWKADGSCTQPLIAVAGCFQIQGVYELSVRGEGGELIATHYVEAYKGEQRVGGIYLSVEDDLMFLNVPVQKEGHVFELTLLRPEGDYLLNSDVLSCEHAKSRAEVRRQIRRILSEL